MGEFEKILRDTSICDRSLFNPYLETEEDRLRKKLCEFEIEVKKLKRKQVKLPERYIINENATILFWEDGEKTVVKRCADDKFNPRLAFLTAFFQHYVDMSKNKANKYLASLQVEVEKEELKQKPKHMKKKTKFKIGDMVEVIEGDDYSQRGWKGKITEIEAGKDCQDKIQIQVKYENDQEWWIYGDQLELIKEEK